MGMYTELVMAIELKADAPTEVIEILEFMVIGGYGKEKPEIKSDHILFNTSRWKYMLLSGSAYFPGVPNSLFRYNDIAKTYFLTVRCNLKSYENEIKKFLHWVAPYSQTGSDRPDTEDYPLVKARESFVGYFHYEEDTEPTLIYFYDGKAYLSEVESKERKPIEI